MGLPFDQDAILRTGTQGSGDRFRAAVFIGEYGPDGADAIGDLLEMLCLRPYRPGKRPKSNPAKSAVIKYNRPGQ